MAEALFFLLIEQIGSALAEEAINHTGFLFVRERTVLTQVRSRMNQIKSEFEVVQAFLSHIGTRKESDPLLEAWVKQVREVAFAVEDTMDLYIYLLAERHRRKSRGFPKKIFRRPSISRGWDSIADELEEILNRLHHLRDMKERYGIKTTAKGDTQSAAIETLQNLADSSHFIDDEEIVGIKESKRLLVQWLLDREPRRTVIAVWGMVGLGKTTLVSKVYRRKIIKAHFDCHAWVTVSQAYRVEGLLRRIVGEFFKEKEGVIPQHIDTLGRRDLIQILHDYLGEKKYLIVLDDVCGTDVWNELRDSFLDNGQGSRIILTTRYHSVALLATRNRVMELEHLNEEEAWSLFCRKAFWKDNERECPSAVESQARELVNKCQGLPLAIVSIGNYLSLRQKKEIEWKKVLDDINWVLNNNPELGLMKSILALSLHDLPDYLKNCFLYCGIFPENYPIKRKRLIRLWVAEGFIKKRGKRSMEEVAEDNLNELVHRCMLQVTERNDFGRVRACRMNGIMRELALSISEREDFYSVRGPAETSSANEARRLSVHRCGSNMHFDRRTMLHLRSFIYFDTTIFPMKFSFKLLRVLDVQGTPLDSVPDGVFSLFNLYYLGLRKTRIRKIPNSIKRLINLQTLDLAYTKIKSLPDGIAELKKLRHLFVHTIGDQTHKSFNEFSGFLAPRGIWDLKDLQTLQGVEAGGKMVKKLKQMTQLRSFRIMKVRAIHCGDLSAAITEMTQLHRLDIVAAEEKESLNMQGISVPPPHLEKLTFRAKLEVAPKWVSSLNNLTWLRLCWSALKEDPLPSICKLPNLVFLLLTRAYDGPRLVFRDGWFPKLKDLRLVDMDCLQQLEIEREALPKLRQLNLVRCETLMEVPQGIWCLQKLEMLYLEEMPREFVGSLGSRNHSKEGLLKRRQSEGQDDYTKIPPIPLVITHVYQEDGRWYGESLKDADLSLYEEEYISMLKEEMDLKEDR